MLATLRSIVTRHPSPRALERYAEPDPSEAMEDARAHRAHVAAHLVRCAECRATVAFRRGLRDALRRLPEPEPSPELLARVLADRARGDRAILPNAWPEPRRRGMPRAAVLAAAAAAAVAVTWWPTHRRAEHRDADQWLGAGSGGMFVGVADAQVRPPRVALPPATPTHAVRLRPRTLVFAIDWMELSGRRTTGRAVLRVDTARVAGVPAWRAVWRHEEFADDPDGPPTKVETDTAWAARDDLRPLARVERLAPYNANYPKLGMTQRFVGDSLLGRMDGEDNDGRRVSRPIARRLPDDARPVLTDPFTPVFLGAVELSRGWTGRVTSTGWAVRADDVLYPIELRVVAEERVTVPAGTFDCWRLVVTTGNRLIDYWVRKRDGVGVRSRDVTPRSQRGVRGVREMVLVRE
ncbi:hypothetical protein J421_1173 [Gemmatirosa kalamazoonensis]|uniref:Zinc-finger domain-containing protein n=1 Tax=Gemmatirosa kalamazoonensis TaxID=861299 RepID=W0REG9_9BACT|nr:hypothetical protein [Gemmatirosa kalamazoonensis]AHG88710.1 hypothetical protein J421_1173 [Gemmatirosa kalamazoonensis]